MCLLKQGDVTSYRCNLYTGTGGMLLECVDNLKHNGEDFRTLKIYGQERNLTSSSIARNYAKVANFDDLKENDFNLNIPLYVEKIIEDNWPRIEEAMADLKQAWQASLEAEEEFKSILKEFL